MTRVLKPVRFLQPTFPPVEEVAADYAAILERGMFTNGGPLDHQLVARVESWVGGGVCAAATLAAARAPERTMTNRPCLMPDTPSRCANG